MTLEEFRNHPAYRELVALTGSEVEVPDPDQERMIMNMTEEELVQRCKWYLELATDPNQR